MSSSSETIIPSKESRRMADVQAILMNLPPEIILDILSRLPIRTIFRCKCVCRQLLELITSAAFAELHLRRSTPGLIVQHTSDHMLKVFEFEDEVEVEHHYLHYKHLMEFDSEAIVTFPDDDRIRMVSSVNGLLCLVDSMIDYFNAFYICNPITREFIALREPEELPGRYVAVCGFGVSSFSGEYKLVRISHDPVVSPSGRVPDLKCLIYTLGTGSWRSITVGISFQLDNGITHAFLNSNLHWLVQDSEDHSFIVCVNLETELFHSLPPIPFPLLGFGSLAILRDCLCIFDFHPDEDIVIWMMKDYGVAESWTKEYVISTAIGYLDWSVYEHVWPLKVFKDGDILFFRQEGGLLYYSSKTETIADAGLVEGPRSARTYPMLHTPSLVSLKRFEKDNVASFEI